MQDARAASSSAKRRSRTSAARSRWPTSPGQSAQAGALVFVGYLALISISLGVLNLLPVPLLDGGHLLYYFAEIIKGSPVSDRAFEVGQRIGMAMLAVLMALALFNDLSRLF